MSADNLIGQYISSTFRKLLQLSDSGSYITDGTGSVVNILPVTSSYALTASYALTSAGTVTSAIYAQTASYSTTLGATLDNSDQANIVYLLASDGTPLSSVAVDNVASANFANTAQIASEISTTGIPNPNGEYFIVLKTGSLVSNYPYTSSFKYSPNTNTINVTASYSNTASFYQETDPVFTAKSASLATTGSNQFNGNQTITGSLTFSTISTPPTPTVGALYFDGTNLYLGV